MASEADLEQQARSGDARAQFLLGRLLLDGPRAAREGRRGLDLIEQAAAGGFGDATAMTALFEAMGINRAADWDRALDRLQLAAEQGSSSARLQLDLLARNSRQARGKSSGGGNSWSALRSRIDVGQLSQSGEHKVLSEKPRVRVIEGFASPTECRWLIERGRERLLPATVFDPVSGRLGGSLARNNSSAEFQIPDMDVVFEVIRARISAAVRLPLPQFEPTQVLHYSPGQEFRPHFDFLNPTNPALREQLQKGQRVGTFLIYLNEGFEGGETEFVDAGLRYKGSTGDAIFWANVDAQRRPDPLSRHAGLPPTSGEKWNSLPMDPRSSRPELIAKQLLLQPLTNTITRMATRAREQEADRAAAAGDFATARALLEEAAQANGSDPSLWMKLSALRKSGGDLAGALSAIERSLAISPREFTALLQRALLLEQLGDARFAEAFGHALAQLPPGVEVPAAMRSVIAHAKERWERHSASVEQHLRSAIPRDLSPEVNRRVERLFRTVRGELGNSTRNQPSSIIQASRKSNSTTAWISRNLSF